MRERYQKKIEERIMGFEPGKAFSAVTFSDIADMNSTNVALYRLEKEGKIRRVIKGIYDIPVYSSLLDEYGVPDVEQAAEAIAEKVNWNIAPSGDTALNLLHISTQVPNVWEYVSDGPYRECELPLS